MWIFDEDDEKRAPMFEYFKARELVKCMGTEECENVNEGEFQNLQYCITVTFFYIIKA